MDSDYRDTCCAASCDADFGFAFNDRNFSDRLLLIEIMGESAETQPGSEGCTSVAVYARRKRRREDNKKENGGEAAISHDSRGNVGSSTVVRTKKLHISSPILAAKSPFFYKLFSNGMRESEQRHVTLRINAFEEHALMELLSFMYSNNLSVTTAPALLDVLVVADKFEVPSCIKCCIKLLENLPMTPESAPLYLELPSGVLMAEAVQPLIDTAKMYIAARYRDITKFEEEVLALPLSGVEALLSSDDLDVESEDAVYDFVLKWARARYPKLEERREVLSGRLATSIRFFGMTCGKLREVLTCNDFDHNVASELVLEALFFKAEAPDPGCRGR